MWSSSGQTSVKLYGLRNQGATCYLSSVLQVLFMTPEIHQALDRHKDTSNPTDQVLRELFHRLKETECGTIKVTEQLQIKDVWRQRCAAEHLELLLNRLSPEVSEVFRGQFTDTTRCGLGHSIIEDITDFWTVPLASDCSSVEEGFQKFFEREHFKDIFCSDCQSSGHAETSSEMSKPPQILVLLLKNFGIDSRGHHYKTHHTVELSETLHTQRTWFSLCGLVDHSGSADRGHYTATLRCSEDGLWYRFNDSHVTKTVEPTGQRSQTAYLLIYRQQNVEKQTNGAPLTLSDKEEKQTSVKQDEPQEKKDIQPWDGERKELAKRLNERLKEELDETNIIIIVTEVDKRFLNCARVGVVWLEDITFTVIYNSRNDTPPRPLSTCFS